MSKEKAQRFLFIGVLILVFSVFFISLSLLEPSPNHEDPPEELPQEPPGEDIPVVYETILAPLNVVDYQTIRKYWSYDAPTEDQHLSIIVFGSRYYMSKGISYSKNDQEFEVIACLSGTVTKVVDSPTYGKCVTIDHGEGLVSEYMSLSTLSVEEGDEVEQGFVIGFSGTNEYDQEAGVHVHFQLKYQDKNINPELLIGRKINEVASLIK